MKEEDPVFKNLVDTFSTLKGVGAILLGGSMATGFSDSGSDYDLYIYTSDDISLEQRKNITDKCCSYMELNNRFWETEDDGVLKGSKPIDIIYRDIQWIEDELAKVVEKHQASVGYTTCLWHNFISSKILFDKDGRAKKLQKRFKVKYPKQLRKSIVAKNYPLLRDSIASYEKQIKKALKRKDLVSVNHRIAAFFASYFDIVFAINEMPHPGEKRILSILKTEAKKLPDDIFEDVAGLLVYGAQAGEKIIDHMNEMINKLDVVVDTSLS